MLGSKKEKTKELVKKLEECEKILEEYRLSVEDILEQKETGEENFTQIIASQAELDKGLTRVVECIQNAKTNTERGNELAESMRNQMEELVTEAKTSAHSVEVLFLGAEKEQESLTSVVEQNKHFTTPAKNLTSETSGMKVEMEALKGEVLRLKDYFRNMSVMSLNAAIEAGRIGEAGKRFVSAAEDIRVFSEEREHTLEDILEQIAGMNGRMEGIDEQVGKLNSLLKENNVTMSHIRKEHGQILEDFRMSGYEPGCDRLEEMRELILQMKEIQKQTWEQENAVLDEMETVGAGFMDEQKAARETETIFRDAMEQIGKIRGINDGKD